MILSIRFSETLDCTNWSSLSVKYNREFNSLPLFRCYLLVIALVLHERLQESRASRYCAGPGPGELHGYDSASPVANSIRLYHHVPYHLSILHDRLGSLAHRPRSLVSCDRSSGLSRDLRILAEDIRCGIRIGCGVRDRDGIPVRHELERAVQNVRADPGPASDVRDLYRLYARGQFLRRPHLWPQPRAAVVLFVFDRDGRAGNDVFGVLDHGQ